MLHCKLLLKKLSKDNFAMYLLQCMLFLALLSLTACECNRTPGSKDKLDQDEKNATITLLTNKQQLSTLDPTFILTLQHKGTSPISLGSYTLELILQEEGGKGTKLKYTDASNQGQEPTSIQESLTHFTTLQALDSTDANFNIPFELVPNPAVNKVIVMVKLYPKDDPTTSQQETITWEGPTPITDEMITAANSKGLTDLVTTLQALKNGRDVAPVQKNKALTSAMDYLPEEVWQALVDRGADTNDRG